MHRRVDTFFEPQFLTTQPCWQSSLSRLGFEDAALDALDVLLHELDAEVLPHNKGS